MEVVNPWRRPVFCTQMVWRWCPSYVGVRRQRTLTHFFPISPPLALRPLALQQNERFFLTPSYLSATLHTVLTGVTYYSPNFKSESSPFAVVLFSVVSGSVWFMRGSIDSGVEAVSKLEKEVERFSPGAREKKKKK